MREFGYQVDWKSIQGKDCFEPMMIEYNSMRSTRTMEQTYVLETMEQKIKDEFKQALVDLKLSDTQAAELLWASPRMIRRWIEKVKPGKQSRVPSAQVFCILWAALTGDDDEN